MKLFLVDLQNQKKIRIKIENAQVHWMQLQIIDGTLNTDHSILTPRRFWHRFC